MSKFSDDWKRDRDAKRLQRDVVQFQRRMASPIARGEVVQFGEAQVMNIASLALAIEALEDTLVGMGVLDPDELMSCMEVIARQKKEQIEAAQATAQQKSASV